MTLSYLHAGLMALGFSLFLAALLVAATLRQRRWWLKVHRGLGAAGTLAVAVGALAALKLVSPGPHLHFPHAWFGLLTILLALTTPLLGLLQFKFPRQADRLRSLHRPAGRLLNLAALLTILMGLRVKGLL